MCFNCEATERVEVPEREPGDQPQSAFQRYSKPLGQRIRDTGAAHSSESAAPPWTSHETGMPAPVRVVDVKLTWGSVFELIFKFSVAFLVIDAVVLIVLALVIAALVN